MLSAVLWKSCPSLVALSVLASAQSAFAAGEVVWVCHYRGTAQVGATVRQARESKQGHFIHFPDGTAYEALRADPGFQESFSFAHPDGVTDYGRDAMYVVYSHLTIPRDPSIHAPVPIYRRGVRVDATPGILTIPGQPEELLGCFRPER
jgi:hypothetical protein